MKLYRTVEDPVGVNLILFVLGVFGATTLCGRGCLVQIGGLLFLFAGILVWMLAVVQFKGTNRWIGIIFMALNIAAFTLMTAMILPGFLEARRTGPIYYPTVVETPK